MISRPVQPITAVDDTIRRMLEDAEIPALLPSLAYITGDMSLLRDDLKQDPLLLRELDAGFSPERREAIRELALGALIRFRDGGSVVLPVPDDEALHSIMEFAVGGDVPGAYLPLLEEELSVTGADLRAPTWTKAEIAPDRPFLVAIIGAGMSGLLAAHRLQQAGIDYVILEKNADVGGTWLQNTYPGCRVDITNHVYSYSFAQRTDWPLHFSTQDVLLDYFRRCADEFGLRDHIRFGTAVTTCDWHESTSTWALQICDADGPETIHANAVISAVGQLNRPKMPVIEGIDSFAGPSFHSAEWRHDVDLTGKRVAVIGTGASAVQFVPIIAEAVSDLTIFQRTPNWFFPVPHYHQSVPAGLTWLFNHVPSYAQWHRFWLFWRGTEGVLPACRVDPQWQPRDVSVSALNDELRQLLTMYLQFEFMEYPDLVDKVIPHYPPASKRVVLDNGSWTGALKKSNVHLETEHIAEITPTGVRTTDGHDHEVDVIIYATGFQASKFLTPMQVTGRDGVDLHEQWDGNARAYLGVTIPNFPNFFCLYGPNTNIVVNGSIIYFSECEVNYTLSCLRLLLERSSRSLDCRSEVHDTYNARVDEGNLLMAWGVSTVSSWYKSESGRVAQNWPFSLLEFWQLTRNVDAEDYVLS